MAFRLAKHARPLAARLSTQQCTPTLQHLRVFSRSSVHSSSSVKPYPIDNLVADVLHTNEQLAANPPKPRGRKKVITKEMGIECGPDLPPVAEWLEYFPWSTDVRARSSIMNPESARELAGAFVPEGSKDKIVVEAFPGPGVLTRALLDLPKERIKKLIVLEEYDRFYQFLKPLEQVDSRITVLPLSGYLWDAYEEVSALGLLDDVQVTDWSQEHPQLQFISHIPAKIHGEQLVSQFFRSIPEQQWLFKYGRVPVDLIMTQSLWQRIAAPLGDNVRCKLSVIAEATATFDHAIPPEIIAPYKTNFYPSTMRQSIQDFVAISIKPLQDQLIQRGLLDEWDYCLRRMFVQKATPLKSSLPQLAPGAATLLKKVTADSLPPSERLNPKTAPRKLTAKEWKVLVQAFADWPFKPEDLSIDNFHMSQTKRETRKVM